MSNYWLNASGAYDPTLCEVIEKENSKEKKARNKQVHDSIKEIKNYLLTKDLELLNRIEIIDLNTGKKYL